jgi:hypothetical protein
MDKTKRSTDDEPIMGRRAFFRGALLTAGAAVTLLGLTACPGGDQEGGDDDADDGGDDD